ncbi:MAG: arginase family protein [Eggerthellaceae bacterium]|jgi:arginase
MILLNGQWQGGADLETFYGSRQLGTYLSSRHSIECMPIDLDASLEIEQGIYGGSILLRQICRTLQFLNTRMPERLIAVGGGCDADVASIAYLNRRLDGDLTVLWMDAHGDLNAPGESASHLFYGMPLRALAGDCPPISDSIARPLAPNQIVLMGSRDLDEGERRYLTCNHVSCIPVLDSIPEMIAHLDSALEASGRTHVYLHLDLDVLDPKDFSATPLPVPHGYHSTHLLAALEHLKTRHLLVGAGLFEYVPQDALPEMIPQIFRLFGL